MADLNFKIVVDTNELNQGSEQAKSQFNNIGKSAVNAGDTIDKAFQKVSGTVSKFGISSAQGLNDAINRQKTAIKNLEKQLDEANSKMSNSSLGTVPVAETQKAEKAVRDLSSELSGEKKALEELQAAQAKMNSVQDTGEKTTQSYRKRIMDLQSALATMMIEAQQNGQDYTKLEGYKELTKELGMVRGAFSDAQNAGKNFANDTALASGVLQGVGAISGAIGGAVGAMTMFGVSNETAAVAQAKLQSAMALTNGVIAIQTVIQKDSAFMTAIGSKVVAAYTAMQNKLAISLGISATAAKALMATLTLGIGVAIIAVIAIISKLSSELKKAKEKQEAFAKAVAEGAKESVTSFYSLQKQWQSLGDSMSKKNKFLQDNADKLKDLTGQVINLTKAEKIFSQEGAQTFVQGMLIRAKAANKYKELEEAVKNQIEYDEKLGIQILNQKIDETEEQYRKRSQEDIDKRIRKEAEKRMKNNAGSPMQRVTYDDKGLPKFEISQDGLTIEEYIFQINKERTSAVERIFKDYMTLTVAEKALFNNVLPEENGIKSKNKFDQQAQIREQLRAEKDLQMQLEQERINSMDEGLQREILQSKLNNDKRTEEIIRQREDAIVKLQQAEQKEWQRLNPKATEAETQSWMPKVKDLNTAQNAEYNDLLTQQSIQFQKEQTKLWEDWGKEMVSSYGTYLERRQAIFDKYDKDFIQYQDGTHDKEIFKARDKELADLDDQYQKSTDFINVLFSDMDKMTSKALKSIRNNALTLLSTLQKFKKDKQLPSEGILSAFNLTEEQFRNLAASDDEFEKILDKIKQLDDEVKKTDKPLAKLSKALSDLFKDTTDHLPFEEKLQKVFSEFDRYLQGVGFLSDAFAELGDATGSEGLKKLASEMESVMSVIDKVIQGAGMGASVGGGWGALIGAVVGLATGLVSAVTKSINSTFDAVINSLQSKINNFERLIKVNEAGQSFQYYRDLAKSIGEVTEMLIQQNLAIQQQKIEENQKKNPDQEALENWENQLIENKLLIEQSRRDAEDAIFGEDIKSAISSFADAYVSAWEAGEDKAKAMKDVVANMIKSVVIEAMKSDLAPMVERIRAKMMQFLADDIISSDENNILQQMAEEAANLLNGRYQWADEYLNNAAREAYTKGFASMSQDTANELNGRFTAIQAHTYNINENMKIVTSNSAQILNTLFRIADDTNRLMNIENRLTGVNNELQLLNQRGVLLRN